MKRIVFTVTESGIDGKAPTKIIFASYSEEQRDSWLASNKNRNYFDTNEHTVDTEKAKKKAFGKLDAVDLLVLGIDELNPHLDNAQE